MAKSKYLKGRKYEYLAKTSLEKEGYTVIRSAGSHSPYDLVAISPLYDEIRLIQIKYNRKLKFKKKVIKALNYQAIVTEELWEYCPSRKPFKTEISSQ